MLWKRLIPPHNESDSQIEVPVMWLTAQACGASLVGRSWKQDHKQVTSTCIRVSRVVERSPVIGGEAVQKLETLRSTNERKAKHRTPVTSSTQNADNTISLIDKIQNALQELTHRLIKSSDRLATIHPSINAFPFLKIS